MGIAPEAGVARVMLHSIALQYMPATGRERIATHAARVGAPATPEAPFAWLAYEIDPTWNLRTVLRLRLWPDGAEAILATGDPHAREFTWLAGAPPPAGSG